MLNKFFKWLFSIHDRTSCYNNCLFYSKNGCTLYGSGHIAEHPCDEYCKVILSEKESLLKALEECEEEV